MPNEAIIRKTIAQIEIRRDVEIALNVSLM